MSDDVAGIINALFFSLRKYKIFFQIFSWVVAGQTRARARNDFWLIQCFKIVMSAKDWIVWADQLINFDDSLFT